MTYRRMLARLAATAGVAMLVLAAWPGAEAGASTTSKRVSIVASSSTCASLFCFKPSMVKASSGTKVTWTDTTSASHTVSRCSVAACGVSGGTGTDAGFGSGVLSPHSSYSFTFHNKGTYVYYCQIHGYAVMHGAVTVS